MDLEPLIDLIKLGGLSILSGILGAFIALWRYRGEKYWDMRANAYTAAIEALSDLSAHYESKLACWENNPIEPKEVSEEIRKARAKIRKMRDMGAFLFSSEAETALSDFVEYNSLDDREIADPGDVYGPLSSIARSSLDKLVKVAKNDLKVKESWL